MEDTIEDKIKLMVHLFTALEELEKALNLSDEFDLVEMSNYNLITHSMDNIKDIFGIVLKGDKSNA